MRHGIYIYSSRSSPALEREGRGGLEDDLEEFLGGAGEVTGGGSGERGWNVDLEVAGDMEAWIPRLRAFLREWGVPEDTYLKVYREGWIEGSTQPPAIPVFGD